MPKKQQLNGEKWKCIWPALAACAPSVGQTFFQTLRTQLKLSKYIFIFHCLIVNCCFIAWKGGLPENLHVLCCHIKLAFLLTCYVFGSCLEVLFLRSQPEMFIWRALLYLTKVGAKQDVTYVDRREAYFLGHSNMMMLYGQGSGERDRRSQSGCPHIMDPPHHMVGVWWFTSSAKTPPNLPDPSSICSLCLLPLVLSFHLPPVSYTHLTLPTMAVV